MGSSRWTLCGTAQKPNLDKDKNELNPYLFGLSSQNSWCTFQAERIGNACYYIWMMFCELLAGFCGQLFWTECTQPSPICPSFRIWSKDALIQCFLFSCLGCGEASGGGVVRVRLMFSTSLIRKHSFNLPLKVGMFSHSYILEMMFGCIFGPPYFKTKQQLADI